MKSTDNSERASADVTRSAPHVVSNFSPAPSPNGKAPAFSSHNSTFYRPGGVINVPVNEVHQHQSGYSGSLDPHAINLLNYNMAIKSLPLRPRPMGPTNMNHQNFAMHQPWQAAQYSLPNSNTQVSYNMQCKPINGFLSQNFFQKVNHEGMQGMQGMHTFQDQISLPQVPLQQPPIAESVLPSDHMQNPSKKDILKKTLLEKSKENAKNAARTACLSPVSDCDIESSNSNSEFASKKSSSKGKKTSSAVPPQQETQMSQSGIFEKLASLGSEHNRKYFLSQLFSFMNVNCTPIKVMPVVCRQTVDLYRLYNIVKEFGGLEKVCKMKQWRDVSSALGFGGSTSAGFALKKNYCKYLFAYECKYDRDDIDPNPILVSLDLLSKLETKKKPQESSQPSDTLLKEDSLSQDSFSELSNGLDEYGSVFEKPTDMPVYLNFGGIMNANGLPNTEKNVEYTKPTRFKRRKLIHHDCGNTSIQKLIKSLSSGLLCEMSWALDCLSVITYDPSAPPLNLSKFPKLMNILLELMASSLDKLITNSNDSQSKSKEKLQDQLNIYFPKEESGEHLILTGYQCINCESEGFYTKRHCSHKSSLVKKNPESFENDGNKKLNLNIPDDVFDIPRRIIDQIVDHEIKQEISEPGEDLFNVSNDILKDLGKKCICISNILRNLASMPWNEKEMAASPILLMFLSFVLHFNHHHFEKTPSRNAEGVEVAEEVKETCLPNSSCIDESFWWWSTVVNIRSNCIVILSYIASHINLSSLHGDICYKLCRGLLHWGVCQSSEAHDLHSGLNISIQRIALEALSKMCISRSNVDFIVATPPFYLVINFVTYAVKILHQNDSDIVRDILLGILSRMVEAESNIARALAIDGSTAFILLGLIDEYIDPSILESAVSSDVFAYDNNPAKTSSYTACKAAEILCQLSRVPENIQYLLRFKKHLLEMVTSVIDDDVLTALISETLAAVC